MKQSQAKQYWEKRLSESYSLGSVGYFGVGEKYNHWIYKARKIRFKSVVNKYISNRNVSCLDLGSGTGFYITQLSNLGFTNITGSDFTEKAYSGLRSKFKNINILQLDITNNNSFPAQTFDLIICMDMLFHIIDESGYEKAIANLFSLLKDDGLLIITENFVPEIKTRGHVFDRTKKYILELFSKNRLKTVEIFPQFIFLNPPVQSTNKWLWRISDFRVSLLKKLANSRMKWINGCIGFLIFNTDRILLNLRFKDYGTSIIMMKKE